jgi:pimeloyl-ACP methyl ester carboxylesterase
MQSSYELLQVETEDYLKLSGLYKVGDKKKSAVIFIHGFTSDFYSHAFYHSFARAVTDKGHACILAQTRGTGLHTEFMTTTGSSRYIGSFFEKIEDAHLDISAFISFLLQEGYEHVILAGHSLGTIKVTRYLFEGAYKEKVTQLVLLAPFDKNAFMHRKAGGKWDKFLQIANDHVAQGNAQDTVPVPEFEDYAISYETFVSWYNKSQLSCLWDFYRPDYDAELLHTIKIPVSVILGELDEYVSYPEYKESASSVLQFLTSHIPKCKTTLIKKANHTFAGYEQHVFDAVNKLL